MSKQIQTDSLIKLVTGPEYIVRESLLRKIIKSIGVKSITLFILIFLLITFVILDIKFHQFSGIIENIIAGFISSIITIFCVDYLISYDKKAKLKEVNFQTNNRFLLRLRGLMTNILWLFGQIASKKEYHKLLYGTPDKKFQELLRNKKLISHKFQKLISYSEKNVTFLFTLCSMIEKYDKQIENEFFKFLPYPNPLLKNKLTYESNWLTARLIGTKFFYRKTFILQLV